VGLYLLPRILVLLVPVTPASDAGWYFSRAAGLVAGLGYSERDVLTAYWPPGWPLTMAVIFKLCGVSLLAVGVFNVASSLIIAWLTWDLGRKLFRSEVAGRTSLLLLALHPNSIGYMPLAWTEVYYTVLLLLGCWLLIACRSGWSLLCAGVVFGVSTLVKAQSFLVIPVIFAIGFLRQSNWIQLWRNTTHAAIVLLVAVSVVLPWSYRNYRVFGEFVFVSTNGGLTLLAGNNPSARGGYTQDDPLMTSLGWSVATQVTADKEARRRAVQWIKENPWRFIVLLPRKVFHLWALDGESEWWFQLGYQYYGQYVLWFRTLRLLNQVYYLCLLAGSGVAAWLLLGRKVVVSDTRLDWWALPYGLGVYLSALALVFCGQPRFHYPVMPFIAMGAGWLVGAVLPEFLSEGGVCRQDPKSS